VSWRIARILKLGEQYYLVGPNPNLHLRLLGGMIGEDKANMARRPDIAPDRPLSYQQLAELRGRLSQMSVTAVRDFYHAAWVRSGLERNASWPRAETIQELVQAWKEMRRARR